MKNKIVPMILMLLLGCGSYQRESNDEKMGDDLMFKNIMRIDKLVFKQTLNIYEVNKSVLLMNYDTNLRDTFFLIHSLQSHVLTELDEIQKLGNENENLTETLDTIQSYLENNPIISSLKVHFLKPINELNIEKDRYADFRLRVNLFFLELFIYINKRIFQTIVFKTEVLEQK